MTPAPLMLREAAESPAALTRQIERQGAAFAELGAALRRTPPRLVLTCARGSSAHAALYGRFLIETRLGVVVAPLSHSVASVYGRSLDLRDALLIVVSQSGRSPDLLRLVETARKGGARVAGFLNSGESPLAALCDHVLTLEAGPERAVAATKSCIASFAAFLHLAAQWSADPVLTAALEELPETLEEAGRQDWGPALAGLAGVTGLYVLGRGVGQGSAAEMALKFKELCGLHGEAFSAAEVMHGPLALVGPGFPVLGLIQEDAAAEQTRTALKRMIGLGAPVLTTEAIEGAAGLLPMAPGLAPEVAPIAALQSFYPAAYRLARLRGLDPEAPPNLTKVVETI